MQHSWPDTLTHPSLVSTEKLLSNHRCDRLLCLSFLCAFCLFFFFPSAHLPLFLYLFYPTNYNECVWERSLHPFLQLANYLWPNVSSQADVKVQWVCVEKACWTAVCVMVEAEQRRSLTLGFRCQFSLKLSEISRSDEDWAATQRTDQV